MSEDRGTEDPVPDLEVAKGQALGNDYLVVDSADLDHPLTSGLIRRICDRHRGIGSDGMLLGRLGDSRFGLRIFNPDGTEAEKSGNGLRIFGAYLYALGRVSLGDPFEVRLPGETVLMEVKEEGPGGSVDIVVEIGTADFRGDAVSFRPEAGEVMGHELDLGNGSRAVVHVVSLGNPHCVVLTDRLDREDFLRRAPRIARHQAFEYGTNVQFARVTGPSTVEAWIWERGANETLASGSSASAVAAVGVRSGLLTPGAVEVEMPGGSVEILVREDYALRLRGMAQMVFRCSVRSDVVEAWRKS